MNARIVGLVVVVAVVCSCSLVNDSVAIVPRVEALRLQLKSRDFGAIYDDASQHVKNNVSRPEFVSRVEKLVNEIERIDPSFAWIPDNSLGKTSETMIGEKHTYFTFYRRVGEGDNRATIFLTWEKEMDDGDARLFGLSGMSHPHADRSFHIETVARMATVK